MKIRLPNSLIHKNGIQDIEKVASDDISCISEDSSTSSRSVRSFLSSRSQSRSKLRRRSRSVREQKSSNANNTNNTNEATNGRKPLSPSSKIMKRLQKSFLSSSSPTSKGGHPQQSFDNDNINTIDAVDDQEKENTIPSSDAGSPNDTTIDSTIFSIVERAVAVNFPSPYIRPVPIKTGDNHGALQPRTDGNKNPAERPTTSQTSVTIEIATKSLDQQDNQTTTKGENVPVIGETADKKMADIYKSDDAGDDSPLSITASNSLLPPLDDECDEVGDENGSQKMLLPTIDQTLVGIGAAGSDVSQEPKSPLSKPSRRDLTLAIPQPPPHCDMNAYVQSPLSQASGRQSQNSTCSSSLSMVRSSLFFDGDDGSNDHIASLTKSTFRPPKEVVTIISVPVTSQLKTPADRRNQQHSQQHQHTAVLDEVEDNGENRASRDSNTVKQKSGTMETGHKKSPHDAERIDEDDEKKTAEELAVKLMKDLEDLREENEKYASKNRRLETKLQILKAQQDEHMVHRGRLIKACLYTAPIFMLCGGLDAFFATILLVWVLVEIEGYLDGGEGNEDDEDGSGDANSEKEDASDFTDDDEDDGFGDDGSSMFL